MDEYLLVRLLGRLRPRYGWLPFALLAGALACLLFSVLEVEWVASDRIIVPAMALGFIVTVTLAHRAIHPVAAWAIVGVAGIALALVLAADLWPPLRVLTSGSGAIGEFTQRQWALFVDRAAGWLVAVRSGGRSTETVVIALGLALAGWLVAAALGWSAYQTRQPYLGLTLVGFALAANTFYGRAGLYWAVFFFGLAITAGTYLNYLYREIEWEQSGTDYSSEVRTDLLIYTAGVSLGIMSLAMAIPAINFRAIADRFQRQEAVVAAEQTMARAFAGVAQPRTDEGAAGAGGMPRSFLLSGDPDLADTVVMTATIRLPASVIAPAGYHWRSVSFDIYTGSGWQRSPEREQPVDRGQPISNGDPVADGGQAVTYTQEINWVYDRRATRYTLGRPVTFDHDLTAMFRGVDDLVGVRGRNNAPLRYTAETRIIPASAEQLRAARPEDIPPEIGARYTALPATIPDRVYQLANEITGVSGATPPLAAYDQARAIEQFLRQYPYSLDLPAPPPDVDIVDYFLFDLQTGFCDYYASAMVVLARAVGLPARLGVGFLQQPADENGAQTIRQIDAHSWAEVYFAGYGWVEFEPTAPFASSAVAPPSPAAGAAPSSTYEPPGAQAVAMPQRAPQRETPWVLLLGLAALALAIWRLWGRSLRERLAGDKANLDETQLAFARLQEGATAIGRPPLPADTPSEFTARLLAAPALAGRQGDELRPAIERLAQLFASRQYGGARPATAAAFAAWNELRGPMRRLIWRRRLGRKTD